MTYAFLLESIWHPPLLFAQAAPPAPPTPEELAVCWLSGAFGRELRAQGKSLKIRSFGRWNPQAGPELIGAQVEIDGTVHRAAIAFAATAASQLDVADHDLLLLFMPRGARGPASSPAPERLSLVLPDTELSAALGRPQREMAIAEAGRCVQPLRRMTSHSIERLLAEAAHRRAELQAERWQRLVGSQGRREALYQVLARALGQRLNELPMAMLAQRVPLELLQRDLSQADALLAGVSGCLDEPCGEGVDCSQRDRWLAAWEALRPEHGCCAGRALRWSCARLHPSQHPQRRLGVLAVLASRWEEFERVALAKPFGAKALGDFLQELEHPFWSQHATLCSPAFPTNVAMCNRNVAMDLAAEWLIPIALAEGRMVWREYLKLRHSAAHEGVRAAVMRLTGCLKRSADWTKRLHHHQGLLQVDQDFLLEDGSDWQDAPYPDSLAQWK
ncbi:MAG TPA: DUF2851 family protein [Luteolibacter sp.]|nr:DUF2851 family protein [Luteolibacter sp.]